jgi:glutamine amidotransferase
MPSRLAPPRAGKPSPVLGVVDLGISNIGSVLRAFERLRCAPAIVRSPDDLHKNRAIVLPGVGAFGDGMKALKEKKLVEPLQVAARAGKPMLGLCLGMQLLADSSEEYGHHEGLGLIHGQVVRLAPGLGDRVPNIGWCGVEARPGARLFRNLPPLTPFYFVHSFHLRCTDAAHSAASIRFGGAVVTVAIEYGNIFGLQCHPEKSQDAGLGVLDAFLTLALRENQ